MPKGIYERSPRAPKAYPGILVEWVRTLYEAGQTQAEIAAGIGVSQKVVWRLMQRHGISTRAPVIRAPKHGADHHFWKGDSAGYKAFHLRIKKARGTPQCCDNCGHKGFDRRYDWANMSGRYDDPTDYVRLCRHCHRQHDNARRGFAPNERMDVTKEAVMKLRASGLSINEIARRLGVSWPTIRKHLP